ncbi:MAG: dipeptide/oligopeptide/nickel ABC transporter ATP-binding protein [Candidatus Omnitrophota bacterium]|jgi:ABC-type oligopeptide transport system ATPase subunit
MLEVKNLKKYFPVERGIFRQTRGWVKAIDGINFKVNKSTTLGIVGRSGSGKTTLAKLLLKLIPPTSGEIIYNTQEITNFRKDVQIIFQNPYQSLNPKMHIGDILQEPLMIHRMSNKGNSIQLVLKSLESVGLNRDVLSRFPIEFSGGQRQRICLARALLLEPKFLILDEPISSLDLTRQVEILDLLKHLKSKFNLTYIFITHNLHLLKEISDSIIVIDKGKIVRPHI